MTIEIFFYDNRLNALAFSDTLRLIKNFLLKLSKNIILFCFNQLIYLVKELPV